MGLFDKIRLMLARTGRLKLKAWADKYGDDLEFVKACIEGGGVEEFQFAGKWLKTDATSILSLVKKYPKILEYCDVVYDKYITKDGCFEEKEVDKVFFASKCCEENLTSFKYLKNSVANSYFKAVKESQTINGELNGKKETIKLKKDDFIINKLLFIRHGIVKCSDFISSI